MERDPKQVAGATCVLYTLVDERHRWTANCRQIVAGVLQGPATGLAICRYDGEDGFYLFGCDEHWSTMTDSWHRTFAEAMRQAEYE